MRLLLLFALLFPLGLRAQFMYVLDQSIPVQDESGTSLAMPWAGGLNASQYNTMDLNFDNQDDLVIFDRMADKVVTFINDNNTYRYAPEYEAFFPEEITNWLLLRDHNCDGLKDIFTGDQLGIKVFTNLSTPEEGLGWEQFMFYAGVDAKSPVILTEGFSSQKINLQLQFDDLPAIIDADGDGDLDIFSIRFFGNGTIEFHQNMSMERYATCDSLDFKRNTIIWGGVTECSCGEFAFNEEACVTAGGGRTKHAGGKSLLALDVDGNATLDMVISEAECSNLSLLTNTSSDVFNPSINTSGDFPTADPAEINFYPAAYYEDVDFDGKKDLIVGCNIYTREYFDTDFRQSNWFYKNTGSSNSPSFTLQQNNFLQDQMIDVGDNAVPAFADMDADGDYDMLISLHSTDATSGFASAIYYYENIGTAEAPSFKLVSNDFLEFRSASFYNLKIQFTDMNNDQKLDLVFTATPFSTRITRLYYILNTGTGAVELSRNNLQSTDFTMAYSENVLVTDVNQDGLKDLLHGNDIGALEYWKNTGSANSPTFALEDEDYLNISSSLLRQNLTAAVSDLTGDGRTDLILGDQTGTLRIISNFRDAENANDAVSDIIYNPILETHRAHNLGGRIWPTVINLFKTNRPVIVVGNTLGGIAVLRNDNTEALPENPVISIYPNPAAKENSITIRMDRPGYVHTFTSLGQQLSDPLLLQADESFTFKIPQGVSPGVYIFRFIIEGRVFARRVVIH